MQPGATAAKQATSAGPVTAPQPAIAAAQASPSKKVQLCGRTASLCFA
jgi:hypothetical protein